MKVGLYFGSFNPVHIGHLIIANHLLENSDINELWFVVTPQNPLKKKSSLLQNYHRLEMVYMALEGYSNMKPCDIEFRLSQPNYTVNTLSYLEEQYPKYDFSLIMGEDNLKHLHKWKNYEVIVRGYPIYVYPRLSKDNTRVCFPEGDIRYVNAPIIEISATHIREQIKQGKSVKPLLSPRVWKYIDDMNFYRK